MLTFGVLNVLNYLPSYLTSSTTTLLGGIMLSAPFLVFSLYPQATAKMGAPAANVPNSKPGFRGLAYLTMIGAALYRRYYGGKCT